jgi:hypothetical protein
VRARLVVVPVCLAIAIAITLAGCGKPKEEPPKPRATPVATERDPVPPIWGADEPEPATATPPSAASPPPSSVSAGAREEDFEDAASCALPAKCAPAALDPATSVTLKRTACLGACPVYSVTVRGDGRVAWNGEAHVATLGPASATIDPKKARELVEMITGSCFLVMRDVYYLPMTDHAWANTTLTLGDRVKTVRHNVGSLGANVESIALPGYCSAPPALDAIEKKIDAVAGTARWIKK